MKKVRIHEPLLRGIEEALERIFGQGKKSDQVVPAILKGHPKWGSRDRNFVAENVYEIVRNKRLLLYVLEETTAEGGSAFTVSSLKVPSERALSPGESRKPEAVGGVLPETAEEAGTTDLARYNGRSAGESDSEGTPAAGTSLCRRMTQAWLIIKGYDDESFCGLDSEKIRKRAAITTPEIRFSVPDGLSELVKRELGEERWYRELEAMSAPAHVFLRVNVNRISRDTLKERLGEKGVLVGEVEDVSTALKLFKRTNLSLIEEFREGYFEIQDGGSQLISPFLGPEPGEFVIDACAGAGGKTLHLADLMKNSGRILALDVETGKLMELEKRVQRNKVNIVTARVAGPELVAEFNGQADRLLLDVPCSGLGVIRRNPDAKEALTAGFLEEIRKVQAEILRDYSRMVKAGGVLVYATCSILPSENREQVALFLAENSDYSLIHDRQIWPSDSGFDGFYMALLQKK